jgi:uncharacterized hydantoinase/oxoprolinase family protein
MLFSLRANITERENPASIPSLSESTTLRTVVETANGQMIKSFAFERLSEAVKRIPEFLLQAHDASHVSPSLSVIG